MVHSLMFRLLVSAIFNFKFSELKRFSLSSVAKVYFILGACSYILFFFKNFLVRENDGISVYSLKTYIKEDVFLPSGFSASSFSRKYAYLCVILRHVPMTVLPETRFLAQRARINVYLFLKFIFLKSDNNISNRLAFFKCKNNEYIKQINIIKKEVKTKRPSVF